ncbi:patched domain-containing protein 3-like [Amphiura filiformis]|uniref:patched domain-containing protein 3-like n=1 Tax=Amphiura filiformis TaxID=82378 RepID=UPI003B2104C2
MRFDCIEKALKWLFYRYGGMVAKQPWPFFIVPILITAGLSVGLFTHFSKESDPETLYGPERTYSRRNRAYIEDVYSNVVDEDMLTRHKTRIGIWGQVIITPNIGSNVLTVQVLNEVLRLHDTITNATCKFQGEDYRFNDLCIKWKNKCHENELLVLLNYTAKNVLSTSLTYPVVSLPTGETFFLGTQLGSVSFTTDGRIISASAMQLIYNLRYNTDDELEKGLLWEKQFLRTLEDFETDKITVYRQISHSFQLELDESSAVTFDLVATVGVVIVTFSVLSAVSFDWVRTKPILACLGVLTAGLALVCSFGLLSFIGVPYANVAGSMPFLIFGIGVDDMFIMISNWRLTSVYKSIKERMKETFQEAALSITITTITDILAFSIGCISQFYYIRLMCMYAAVSVIFAYIYMITFFAACMVFIGHREEKNRHAITLRKVLPKKNAPSKSYYIFCAGGSSVDSQDYGNVSDSGLMIFFKKYYGPFITHWVSVVVVLILYVGYLVVAIWGFTNLDEGLDLNTVGTDDSYLNAYYGVEESYFKVYGPDMSIVATEELSYWDTDIQEELENTMAKLEDSKYFHNSSISISWLREYLNFLNILGITNPSKETFLQVLREQFLSIPVFEQFVPDIIFDSTNSSIISSRFYVIGKNLVTSVRLGNMFLEIRKVLDTSNLELITYHGYAPWFMEQFIAIRQNTVLTLSIGISAMFVISLLLIPHPVCCTIVTISLVSTIIGILGYMSIWNISLDVISMLSLILALGFSVDYSAHITYAFVSSSAKTRRERSIFSLFSLGAPTLQGATSTILAVSVLSGSFSYIYRTFFSTMVLVISIGATHGLVFLPVFLMLFVPIKNPCREHAQTADEQDDAKRYKSVYLSRDNDDIRELSSFSCLYF